MRTTEQYDADIVAFVVAYLLGHGYGPSYREVADHIGRPLVYASTRIAHLITKGRLLGTPKVARSLRPAHGPVQADG